MILSLSHRRASGAQFQPLHSRHSRSIPQGRPHRHTDTSRGTTGRSFRLPGRLGGIRIGVAIVYTATAQPDVVAWFDRVTVATARACALILFARLEARIRIESHAPNLRPLVPLRSSVYDERMSVPRKLTEDESRWLEYLEVAGRRLAYVEARLAEAERLLRLSMREVGYTEWPHFIEVKGFLAEVTHE
jgi:hypothetical protein